MKGEVKVYGGNGGRTNLGFISLGKKIKIRASHLSESLTHFILHIKIQRNTIRASISQ